MSAPIYSMNVEAVKNWMISLGLPQYASIIQKNDIDGFVLSTISESDWKELGVESFGHRRTLQVECEKLKTQPATTTTTTTTVPIAINDAPPNYDEVIRPPRISSANLQLPVAMEEKSTTNSHPPPTLLPSTTLPYRETVPQYIPPINNNTNRNNINLARQKPSKRESAPIVTISRPISELEQPPPRVKRAFCIQIFIDLIAFFFKFIFWVFAYSLMVVAFIFVILHPHLFFIWIGCMLSPAPNKTKVTLVVIFVALFQGLGCSGICILFGWLSLVAIYRIPFAAYEMINVGKDADNINWGTSFGQSFGFKATVTWCSQFFLVCLDILTLIPFLVIILTIHRAKSMFIRLRRHTFKDFFTGSMHTTIWSELGYFGYPYSYVVEN